MPESKETAIRSPAQSRWYRGLIPFLLTVLSLTVGYLGLRATGPTLYDSNASVSGDLLSVTITNKGRTARIGEGQCAAGAYLTPGSGRITKLIAGHTSDIFRRSFLAPDQSDVLSMFTPASINKDPTLPVNPLLRLVNADTSWAVVCTIPYWDTLGKWFKSDSLNLCYEVQPGGPGGQRQAVICPPSVIKKEMVELGVN